LRVGCGDGGGGVCVGVGVMVGVIVGVTVGVGDNGIPVPQRLSHDIDL